jgi:hypothetical protein
MIENSNARRLDYSQLPEPIYNFLKLCSCKDLHNMVVTRAYGNLNTLLSQYPVDNIELYIAKRYNYMLYMNKIQTIKQYLFSLSYIVSILLIPPSVLHILFPYDTSYIIAVCTTIDICFVCWYLYWYDNNNIYNNIKRNIRYVFKWWIDLLSYRADIQDYAMNN